MQKTQDILYKQSLNGQNFYHLMDLVISDENIQLAYRNIKKNSGSNTAGTDKKTMKDLEKLTVEQIIILIRNKLKWYKPQSVKRVEIPKSNGKMRPLGIPTITDRLIQQCFLQILEPICEAKFHERSYGFRPLRSANNAMAAYYKLIQQGNLHYVVDVDIKGFFDNISHGKLLKQLWYLGIRDKKVISIISAMLKAEVAGIGFPKKGTPQGGIISPLLANVVLNELDWWVSDQWQTFQTKKQYSTPVRKNGTLNQASKLAAMKTTNLKEGWIVRYADDFKIVCRSYTDAQKWYFAVKQWLKERLGLDISEEKSKIVNLKRNYSEFLGLKIKAVRKGYDSRRKAKVPKFVVESHICDKSLKRIAETAHDRIKDIHSAGNGEQLLKATGRYNAFVIGMHNYYQMATHVAADVNRIDYYAMRTLEKRTHCKLKRFAKKENDNHHQYILDRYGRSKRLKEWRGQPIVPISFVQTKAPSMKRVNVNQYTPEGRTAVHKNLNGINLDVLYYMMRNPIPNKSMEYNDNRLSLYCGQGGKCAITGTDLLIFDMHCHHIIPSSMGGTDKYENLLLITKDAHTLLHAQKEETINKLLQKLNLNSNQKKKINYWRTKMGLMGI
ncbi:group II intron reverse transcriptase/maturase [Lachnoclostridium sp. An118]|uniref:group II intron reverse transcriptase/maturase n=1 Tax=Lachnoclostridium sp. An118 TaxID=1965547 RepID=UPI003FA5C78C